MGHLEASSPEAMCVCGHQAKDHADETGTCQACGNCLLYHEDTGPEDPVAPPKEVTP